MAERGLAVVTGASSGIGATFARKLARRGYDLLLIARREDRLRSLAAEIAEANHVAVEPMVADLVREADLENVAERIRAAANLALLVNNAGFGTLGYFEEADVRGQVDMHRLHVVATARLTHAALETLVPRGSGGVINISSVAAWGMSPQNVSYCSTKAWMNRFTEGLAIELGARSSAVKVQALCPGFTFSEFQDKMGLDRKLIPRSLWMSPDFVVEESLHGFDHGKVIVVPGWRYKLLVAVMRLLPAPLMRWGSILAVRRYRRPRRDVS